MELLEPGGTEGLGNTKAKPSRGSYGKKWCFTLNNWNIEQLEKLKNILGTNGTYIMGKEVGEEKGTPHLQGYVEFNKRVRPIEFVGIKEVSWRIAKGNRQQNLDYCSKEGDYITTFKIPKKIKIIEELRPWQKYVENIIKEEPDDRNIYWFWEEVGNTGKTALSKYLCVKYGAVIVDGKKNDILYTCAEFESEIYIFDLSRTIENYVSYDAIEKVKNGLFMCAKYESKPIVRNSPHVIIFANFRPHYESLSKDRWKDININEILV